LSNTTEKRHEERGLDVAYETKVLLIAIAKIISKADSIEEVYKAVQLMANAEGLVLQSLEEMKELVETKDS